MANENLQASLEDQERRLREQHGNDFEVSTDKMVRLLREQQKELD